MKLKLWEDGRKQHELSLVGSNPPQLQWVPTEVGNVALPTAEATHSDVHFCRLWKHWPSLFSSRRARVASRDAKLFKETLHKDEENIYSVHLTIQPLPFTLTKTLEKYLKMRIYSCIKSNSVSVRSIKSVTLHTSVPLLQMLFPCDPEALGQSLHFRFSKKWLVTWQWYYTFY